MTKPLCLLLALLAGSSLARGADDAWTQARASVASLNWSLAERQYAALRDASPAGSAQWTEATFGQAVACQHLQPASARTIAQAANLFGQIINTSGNEAFIARAMLNLGRIAELRDYPGDAIDLDQAIEHYQTVMRRWPELPIGSEAALRAGAAGVMAFDGPAFTKVRAGLKLLEDWLAAHPDNPYAGVMWQYCGDTYFAPLNQQAEALRCYQQVDRIGWPDAGNQAPLLWRCAQIAERTTHDRDAAIHFYTELITQTPTSVKLYLARAALQRLGAPLPPTPMLDAPAAGGHS